MAAATAGAHPVMAHPAEMASSQGSCTTQGITCLRPLGWVTMPGPVTGARGVESHRWLGPCACASHTTVATEPGKDRVHN